MNFVNTALRNEKERVVQLQKENKQESFTVERAAKTLSVEPSDILRLIGSGDLLLLEPIRIISKSVYDFWIAKLDSQDSDKGRLTQSATMKANWADPVFRAKVQEGRAKAKAKREAHFEPTTIIRTMEADRAAFSRSCPPVAKPYVSPHTLRYRELTDRLKREFPLAFANPPDVKPSALDIYTQVCTALPETDPGDLLRVIDYYQKGFAYLAAVAKPGARRVHLDGTDAGAVTASEAKEARDLRQELIFRKEEGRQ